MDDAARYDFDTKVREITERLTGHIFPLGMGPRRNILVEHEPGAYSVTNLTLDDLVRDVLQWGESWDRAFPFRKTPREG